jgi:hypothetical protein
MFFPLFFCERRNDYLLGGEVRGSGRLMSKSRSRAERKLLELDGIGGRASPGLKIHMLWAQFFPSLQNIIYSGLEILIPMLYATYVMFRQA